jgi:hypothetical protein
MNCHFGIRTGAKGLLVFVVSAGLALRPVAAADNKDAARASEAANASAPAGSGRTPSGSLIGVTLGPGGYSLAAVEVVIRSMSGSLIRQFVSDADGSFLLKDLAPGAYQITAAKEGFSTLAASSVEIAENKTSNANVQLTQGIAGALRGVTLGPDGFVQGAVNIAVRSVAGSVDRHMLSDADGMFVLKDLPLGSYQVTASKEGLASTSTITVEVAQNRTSNANLQLAKAEPPAPPQSQSALPPNQPVPPTKSTDASASSAAPTTATVATVDTQTPFAFGDFTWLNGTPRNKDVAFDTPFFTPEVRFDTHYMQSFNQPVDHTMGGSTESFRSGEVQVEQISVGGDFHWNNVRGRILTMFGLFATTTPRNDASAGVGQWDLRNAYRYVSEAYGGYHFNVNHGLNIDAGIFVS